MVATVVLKLLATVLTVTLCQAISLTLDLEHSSLCSGIVLICSFDNVHFVRFEESVAEERFSTLTSNYIASNPDYEEVASDGLYRLMITQPEKYNGTRYRCNGFNEDLSQVFRSDEWKLIVPPKDICATLEMNVTATTVPAMQDIYSTSIVSMNSTSIVSMNSTSIVSVNSTMQAYLEEDHQFGVEEAPTLIAALLSLCVVPVVALIAAPLCVVVACARRHKTGKAALHAVSKDNSLPAVGQDSDDVTNSYSPKMAAECLPTSVQEDGDVDNSDLPVMAELKVDRDFSTHVAVRFSGSLSDLEIEVLPHSKGSKTNNTMYQTCTSTYRGIESDAVAEARVPAPGVASTEVLQSPQVASTNDAVGAVQVAGRVIKYDNVIFKRDRTRWQSALEQHPPVLCAEVPALLIPSRSNHGIVSEDVPMSHNPSYVAVEFFHQHVPAKATDVPFHQPASPDTSSKDVPMQGNPAYEALETIIQTSQTLGQEHRLQPLGGTGGTELLEDVPMQDNPAYGAFEAICPSMRTRSGVLQFIPVEQKSMPMK